MLRISVLIVCVAVAFAGCRQQGPQPKASNGGVKVDAPGVQVDTHGGTTVNAPGVHVDAGNGGANVSAPGVDVKTK